MVGGADWLARQGAEALWSYRQLHGRQPISRSLGDPLGRIARVQRVVTRSRAA